MVDKFVKHRLDAIDVKTICCLSDTHGFLPDIPKCDLLLIAGDICPAHDHNITFQGCWLNDNFYKWLKELKKSGTIKCAVFIAGNHDFFFEKYNHQSSFASFSNTDHEMLAEPSGIYYLQDSSITIGGLKIWGTPWQPIFYNWAFNLSEAQLAEKWKLIPNDTDIVVVHGPPHGHRDLTWAIEDEEEWPGKKHVGSPSLTERIRQVKPKLVVTGHIHSAYGVSQLDESLIVNTSYVDESYKPAHEPVLVSVTDWKVKQ
jgi:Icc-related predicted phosphoesterase